VTEQVFGVYLGLKQANGAEVWAEIVQNERMAPRCGRKSLLVVCVVAGGLVCRWWESVLARGAWCVVLVDVDRGWFLGG
jgi:hypothetical protein